MSEKPKILTKQVVAKSRYFTIEALHLQFANGQERQFERLMGRADGAVLIVPMLDDETILLVREYAAGVDRYEIGFPKGLVEPDEDILTAANRELMEEIGYEAQKLTPISHMTASPGYWGSNTQIILARDLRPKKIPGDEPEPLQVIPWKISDYRDLLSRDDFSEARSIAALLLVKEMYSS